MSLRIIVCSVAVLLLGGCGFVSGGAKPTPTPETFTLKGAVTLSGDTKSYTWEPGEPCSGSGGYSDLRGGSDVVVKDREGTVIGKGSLGSGVGVAVRQDCGAPGEHPLCDPMGGRVCKLSFTVDGIPRSDFYVVEMGKRGQFTYSFDEIQSQDWSVEYAIGD
jgi:hypothetical protein